MKFAAIALSGIAPHSSKTKTDRLSVVKTESVSFPSRRDAIKSAALSFGTLSLPGLFEARAAAVSRADTAVIFVTLGGGPSQFETYDPKPDANPAIRSRFGSVATSVPGIHFCELLPRQAAIMDRLAIVRSVTHKQASHIAEHIVETGYDLVNSANSLKGEMPSVGSVVSKVRGTGSLGIPSFVTLPDRKAYGGPHWLGGQHRHFAVNDDPNTSGFAVQNLTIGKNLNLARLEDRRSLLGDLDAARREFDAHAEAQSIEAFAGQAFDLVTGERSRAAFQIDAEPAATRDRYGRTILGQRLLLARRLVEAGVPFVTVRMGDWDDHKDLAARIAPRCEAYDIGMRALLDDLRDRGLSGRVLVVAMGEFGRTPKVNADGGRDHWPAANNVLISGGSYRMGQVIGETDANGAYPIRAPYAPQSVLAMVYRHLGIDPGMTFDDFTGRPRYVLEERQMIRELI